MDTETQARIIQTISAFIAEKDGILKSNGAIFGIHESGISKIGKLNDCINGYAEQLSRILPDMNFAEISAFADLMSSRRAQLQMLQQKQSH